MTPAQRRAKRIADALGRLTIGGEIYRFFRRNNYEDQELERVFKILDDSAIEPKDWTLEFFLNGAWKQVHLTDVYAYATEDDAVDAAYRFTRQNNALYRPVKRSV